jgi:hypothetical protein
LEFLHVSESAFVTRSVPRDEWYCIAYRSSYGIFDDYRQEAPDKIDKKVELRGVAATPVWTEWLIRDMVVVCDQALQLVNRRSGHSRLSQQSG